LSAFFFDGIGCLWVCLGRQDHVIEKNRNENEDEANDENGNHGVSE
jgi:hypothetical protein